MRSQRIQVEHDRSHEKDKKRSGETTNDSFAMLSSRNKTSKLKETSTALGYCSNFAEAILRQWEEPAKIYTGPTPQLSINKKCFIVRETE